MICSAHWIAIIVCLVHQPLEQDTMLIIQFVFHRMFLRLNVTVPSVAILFKISCTTRIARFRTCSFGHVWLCVRPLKSSILSVTMCATKRHLFMYPLYTRKDSTHAKRFFSCVFFSFFLRNLGCRNSTHLCTAFLFTKK